jgi:hypothetical protein
VREKTPTTDRELASLIAWPCSSSASRDNHVSTSATPTAVVATQGTTTNTAQARQSSLAASGANVCRCCAETRWGALGVSLITFVCVPSGVRACMFAKVSF